MSFLTERIFRAALPLSRRVAVQAPRSFSTSLAWRKTPTESVKDGLKTVDRAVTDNVVIPGIDAAGALFLTLRSPQRYVSLTSLYL